MSAYDATRQQQIRRLLTTLDDDDAGGDDLPYAEVLRRLLALLATELVRARKEPDACL